MSKKHTLPDGFYKIPYSNEEYFIVQNNLVKAVSIASGILYVGFNFMSISGYLAKNLVPLTDEEKVELL